MESSEKLAYFLDEDSLRAIFPDWPEETAVVLCLDEEGGCETLVYHRDEGRAVLRKVAAVLDRPLGQFLVAPQIDGYPTRKVLFSEEQQLLKLLGGVEDLPEIAADYAHDYHQARAEGRSPDELAQPDPREAAPALPRRTRFTLRKVLRKPEPPEPVELPPGYSLSSARSRAECLFAEAQIYGHEQRIRLVIEPDKVTLHTKPVRVAEVGFRDDFARFVLPRAALKSWRPGEPVLLEMPVEHFPAGLAERLTAQPRQAEVTVTRQGVFVHPGAPAQVAPVVAPRGPRLWRAPPSLKVAALALLAVGTLGGGVVWAMRPAPQLAAVPAPQVAQVQPQPEQPAAMELLTALAREEARGAME